MRAYGPTKWQERAGRIAAVTLGLLSLAAATALVLGGIRVWRMLTPSNQGSALPLLMILGGVLLYLIGAVFLILPFLAERGSRLAPPRGFPTVSRAFGMVWSMIKFVGALLYFG